jgi:hypothetical protein
VPSPQAVSWTGTSEVAADITRPREEFFLHDPIPLLSYTLELAIRRLFLRSAFPIILQEPFVIKKFLKNFHPFQKEKEY